MHYFRVIDCEQVILQHTEASEEKKVIKTLYDHTACVNEIVFHPNGAVVASCADDFNIKLYDLSKTHAKRGFRYLGDAYPVQSISFHPSGDYIISGTDHHAVRYIHPTQDIRHPHAQMLHPTERKRSPRSRYHPSVSITNSDDMRRTPISSCRARSTAQSKSTTGSHRAVYQRSHKPTAATQSRASSSQKTAGVSCQRDSTVSDGYGTCHPQNALQSLKALLSRSTRRVWHSRTMNRTFTGSMTRRWR
jgi:WD40 repeat protein